MQKASTERMNRTVIPWSIRGITVSKAYKKQYSNNPFGNTTIEAGTRLVDRMMKEKNKRLEDVITSTDLTHNSSKEWKTIIQEPAIIPPFQHQILINGQGTMSNKPKHSGLHTDAVKEVTMVYTFFEEEYRKGIAPPKNGKAAGIDNVLVVNS